MSAVAFATVNIVAIACGECGVTFGLSDAFMAARKSDHKTWYCPNGHSRWYPPETVTEADRLRKELAREQERTAYEKRQREHAESNAKGARIAAGKAKAAHARVLTRVRAGVCPHCKRTFKQLAAHMQCKHGGR